ncbi:MAG: acyl--CoA ligase [Sphingomonadaceae bacterium]|nr:acyl--CoA ligase [Sphingomonadaceae bacterium]
MTEIRRLPDALRVRAQHQRDEIAHDDGRRALSFAAWNDAADALGGGLAARGLRPGDRVLLPISNAYAVEMLIAVQGVLRAGGIACPVNPRLMPDEMAAYARLIEPAMTITDIPDRMADAGAGTVFAVDAMPSDPAALPDQAALDMTADAIILQTSGTTGGKLKGVVIAHPDLLGSTDGISRQASRSMAHALPLTGSGGAMAAGLQPIRSGATVYTMRKFDPEGFLQLVAEKKPDTIFLVPAMLRLILDLPNVADYNLTGTKWLITGSAPLPHDTVVRALALWPHMRMRNSYAMSEGGAALSTTTREQLVKPGCVGKMADTLELRDEEGKPVSQGQTGEIYGRQGKPRRYWRDEEATQASFVGEWTRSGDLGYVDADGDLILCGRSKELIIRGGYNITPLEIETVLHDHPAVKDAAVVGIGHEVLGEDVAAAVALATGAQASPEELEAWCRARLADNKVPRTILILDELPLNPNGKFLKRELKPLLEEAAAARKVAATAR